MRRVDILRHALGPVGLSALVIGFAACAGAEGEEDTGEARHAIGAGAILQSGQTPSTQSTAQGSAADPGEFVPDDGEQIDVDLLGFDRGVGEAPVRILEFSDFGCSYCRKFHMESMPALNEEYMQQGKVLWKQVPFVMGNWANSIPASLAAECSLEQDRFDAMSHSLYERQADWKNVSAEESDEALRDIAREVGLDMDDFEQCMTSDELMWRVQVHTMLARQIGVRSTPTFFVVGYQPIQGALPLDLFRQVLDTVLVTETRLAESEGGN